MTLEAKEQASRHTAFRAAWLFDHVSFEKKLANC
jgi:hypothetical protein